MKVTVIKTDGKKMRHYNVESIGQDGKFVIFNDSKGLIGYNTDSVERFRVNEDFEQ